MGFRLPDPVINHGSWEDNRDGLQRDLDALALGVPGTGGKDVEIRFGLATLSFSASASSNQPTVTHGLGRVPVGVVATAFDAPAFGNIPACNTSNYTDTTFIVDGDVKTAFTGTVQVFWIAIG